MMKRFSAERFEESTDLTRFFLMFVLLVSLFSSGCEKKKPAPTEAESGWLERNTLVFHGIPARMLVETPNKKARTEAQTAFDETFEAVEKVFSAFSKDSEIGRLNTSTEDSAVPISGDLFRALEISRDIHDRTEGAYDPTVWPLKRLWSRAKKNQKLPEKDVLSAALERVGMDRLKFFRNKEKEPMLQKLSGVSLDFGGMAKGLVVDRISERLKRAGIENGLVQCGGEIRSWGKNNNGKPWHIGVQHPLEENKLYGTVQADGDISLSTSGNYRQPIEIGDVTYYHIFDPKSGQPVSTDVLGVTVLIRGRDDGNARADALATAMAVMGPEKGLQAAKAAGAEVLFILKGADEKSPTRPVMSAGFEQVFKPVLP